ncbi:metal ABC transporter permease [Paracandidimonas soli]|uniref:Manganese/zinc/iron transport system permease protein n=2 Tax=Paracandidimonas soli TaxID=1917182 RepID=A0A4R3VAH9_9BURK|nr:manganese/zinc/iron transport system permease protein [Paracandidimonas soli]
MDMSSEFLQLSLTPLLIALLACIACALPGNFLVLRRQSLIGDAISHVVLLGIVGAFVFTGTLDTVPMLLGAMISAVLAVALIELIRFLGKVEPGAAMGVVFTALFAAGVLWLEQSNSSSVHLDVEHVLYGNLESLIWLDAERWSSLLDPEALAWLPPQLPRLAWVLSVVVLFLTVFWRRLVLGTFDANFAASVGARPALTNLALLVVVALAAVAAFEAVGAIIVVAMFICPPATARLMTDSLKRQIAWSVAFAGISAVGGYVLAAWGPLWLGYENSVSAAGMIALLSGAMLMLAAVFGPHRQ